MSAGSGARAVNKAMRSLLGVELRRVRNSEPAQKVPTTKNTVLFEVDDDFNRIYQASVEHSGTPGPGLPGSPSERMRERLYNLAQLVRLTRGVEGLVAECGCYRGLSAFVLCHYLHNEDPSFSGELLHVFDSFEGLSEPGANDGIDDPNIPVGGVPRAAGLFRAGLDHVRQTLAGFPDVRFHPGWIPECFASAPEGPYRLVHVDVDLHDPTRDSVEFFHSRLAPGGVLVCDDYGAVRWPGARRALDEYSARSGVPLLSLSSGQALLFNASDRNLRAP